MGCKGIHCDGCKSDSGITTIIVILVAFMLAMYGGAVFVDHFMKEIMITLGIIIGLSIGAFTCLVLGIRKYNKRTYFHLNWEPTATNAARRIRASRKQISDQTPKTVNATITSLTIHPKSAKELRK